MKIPCSVIRDLLPLYAEKMVEPETENLVAEHLADCSDCREKLSAMKEKAEPAIETAKPLLNLKKQIRRRRWRAVAIAALCVFIILFTSFYHTSKLNMLPWKEGLIKVKGVEIVSPENRLGRTYHTLYERDTEEIVPEKYTGEALVFDTDSSIVGTMCTSFRDDDGTLTAVLQGIGRDSYSMNAGGAARELGLYPVPDRVIYDGGNSQELLWGEPLNGGTEVLPRLALAYYLLIAVPREESRKNHEASLFCPDSVYCRTHSSKGNGNNKLLHGKRTVFYPDDCNCIILPIYISVAGLAATQKRALI